MANRRGRQERPGAHPDVSSVIVAAEQAIGFARRGWADYLARSDRSDVGLLNAITMSHKVRDILKNARKMVPGFDRWWEDAKEAWETPAGEWVSDTRNLIEHQGTVGDVWITVNFSMTEEAMRELRRQAPAGTTGMFAGDQLGRMGWDVKLADGTHQAVYFTVPHEFYDSTMTIRTLDDQAVEDFMPQFLDAVESVIKDFKGKFGQHNS